jgi:hypothetical protein
MKTIMILLLLILLMPLAIAQAGPVSNAFTYQGRLLDSGMPVNGQVDLQVYLYDAENAGTEIAGGFQFNDVAVDQGAFTVLLDWASANWNGDERWLEIHVRNPHDPGDTGPFTQLDPRQQITVVPYAIHALNATGGGGSSGLWSATGNDISNTNSGFVGIGRSTPYAPGEIFGIDSTVDGYTGMYITADDGFDAQPLYGYRTQFFEAYHYLTSLGTWGLFNTGQNLYFTIEGKLGVGTPTPGSTITAAGMVESTAGGFKFPDGTIQITAGGGGGGGPSEELVLTDSSANQTVELMASEMGAGTAAGPLLRLRNTLGARTVSLGGGNVGGGNLSMFNGDGGPGIKLKAQSGIGLDNGSHIEMFRFDGTSTLELWADYNETGESRVVANVVEITGGADLSEHFDVAEGTGAVSPGSVVCIDPGSPGDLRLSTEAYDRKVAGIISGADGVKPGLLMGQKGTEADGDYPVALTGRVYCKVDAQFGAIAPGDLLTTSPTAGYAMKVTNHTEAQGAILGKAMTALEAGQGMVLVLVSLQ